MNLNKTTTPQSKTMLPTPVALVGGKNPETYKEIQNISKKWEKRTKGLQYPWPKGGTFDMTVCESMETRIRDHKPKEQSDKRLKKRELELKILKLFKDEGQQYRAKIRQGLAKIQNSGSKDMNLEEKQLNMTEIAGLYPNLEGWLHFNGNIKEPTTEEISQIVCNEDGQDEDKVTTPRGDKSMTPKNSKNNLSGTNDSLTKAVIAEKWEKHMREATDEKTPAGVRILSPKHCSTARKTRRSGPAVLDCYEGRKSAGGEQSCSYWLDLPREGIDPRRERNRSAIREMEEDLDRQAAQLGGDEEGEQEEEELKVNLRNRALLKKPDRYNNEHYMAPILIKGTDGHYIPWQTLDLTSLVSKLPDIHDGASKWIRAFEEATTGKLLALGDMKAVWVESLGASTMEDMLKHNEYGWMLDPMADGTEFNAYRGKLWSALRKEYPTRVNPKALRGDPFTETDNPATYINNQLKKWRQETEEDIEPSQVLTTLFRDSIIDALPTPVQSRLRDVVGLTTMPHRQFCDNVIHAVERHRKDEQRMKEQDRDVQRKIAQLQLNELQGKGKAKVQAPTTTEKTDSTPESAPTMQPMPPTQPPLVANVYSQPYQLPYQQQYNSHRQYGGRQGRGPPGLCWGCGEAGHRMIACPQAGPGWLEGREEPGAAQGGETGPANPWAGPNHGY